MGIKVGDTGGTAGTQGKGPTLTLGAARYQQAIANQLAKTGNADEVAKARHALTPADERSFREVSAFHMREAAQADLKDPVKRDNAQLTLNMLDKGELPAGPGLALRIDNGAEVRVPAARSWKAP